MAEIAQETIAVDKQPAMTEQSLGYLKTSSGWAQFLAIVSFINCGLLVVFGILLLIMSFVMGGALVKDDNITLSMIGLTSGMFVSIGVFYLILGGIGFLVAYYLYKFATDSKKAVLMRDTESLTSSMGAISKYFKILGILTIVTLILTFFWIPIAIFMNI